MTTEQAEKLREMADAEARELRDQNIGILKAEKQRLHGEPGNALQAQQIREVQERMAKVEQYTEERLEANRAMENALKAQANREEQQLKELAQAGELERLRLTEQEIARRDTEALHKLTSVHAEERLKQEQIVKQEQEMRERERFGRNDDPNGPGGRGA